jgi:hypothetical protein
MNKKSFFKKNSLLLLLVFTFTFTLNYSKCFGWGSRGHSIVCEAAIHLVKNEGLKNFLLHRTLAVNYLCNIPDTFWRKPEFSKTGNPTHHIDTDLVGINISDTPVVYSEFIEKFKNKTRVINNAPIFSVPKEIGSSWWRAAQFVELAVANGKKAKTLELPSKSDERNDENPYNKEILSMLTSMGILGHFVGDNSQPMHTTSNYD